MNVLLLRLVAPMQSWGVESRFGVRDTGLEPSKSGVIGLLCAALGRPRGASIDDLAGLRMAARVDCQGRLESDYHTAQNVLKAGGGFKDTELSRRYYLAGARFLVGLEGGDLGLLEQVHAALKDPHWPLYLGRKAFVPGEPVWLRDGLRPSADLEDVVSRYPWLGQGDPQDPVRLSVEDPSGSVVRPDQPVCFGERRFAPRRVRTAFVTPPGRSPGGEEALPCT